MYCRWPEPRPSLLSLPPDSSPPTSSHLQLNVAERHRSGVHSLRLGPLPVAVLAHPLQRLCLDPHAAGGVLLAVPSQLGWRAARQQQLVPITCRLPPSKELPRLQRLHSLLRASCSPQLAPLQGGEGRQAGRLKEAAEASTWRVVEVWLKVFELGATGGTRRERQKGRGARRREGGQPLC